MTAARAYRLVGAWRIEAESALTVTQASGANITPGFSGEMTPGLYYPCGDGALHRDAIHLVNDAIATAIAASSVPSMTCVLSIDRDTGELEVTVTGASSITIEIDGDVVGGGSAGTDALDVFEWLGLYSPGGATAIVLTTGKPRPRPTYPLPHFTFYPRYYLVEDLERRDEEVSQYLPTRGNPQTIWVGNRSGREVRLRTDGYPREPGFGEYHHLDAFMAAAAAGMPWRMYSNIDVATEYSTADRRGYRHLVLDSDSAGWRPEPDQGGWHRRNTVSLDCWAYTPT